MWSVNVEEDWSEWLLPGCRQQCGEGCYGNSPKFRPRQTQVSVWVSERLKMRCLFVPVYKWSLLTVNILFRFQRNRVETGRHTIQREQHHHPWGVARGCFTRQVIFRVEFYKHHVITSCLQAKYKKAQTGLMWFIHSHHKACGCEVGSFTHNMTVIEILILPASNHSIKMQRL